MSGYSDFSRFYDLLNTDAEYDRRTEYITELFKKYGNEPTLMLDFACGTGAFSRRFAKNGVEVIGVDPSEDMLCVARRFDDGVLYLCQNAETLELYGTVNGAVCCLDSINHITDEAELQKAFSAISLYLEKGSLFIFDVNTEFKHKFVLGDNTFVLDTDEVYCVWQNFFDEETLNVDIELDFFEKKENSDYSRYTDGFTERVYSFEELNKMLCNAGLEVLDVLGDISFDKPDDFSERVYYVTRKV